LGKIKHHGIDNNFGPSSKQDLHEDQLPRFLGDIPTPRTIFLNTLSVVSSIFTIWGFIETRDEIKEMKKLQEQEETNESNQAELLKELNHKLEGVNSGITDEMKNVKKNLNQLICRFDAVHAKTKGINQECLKFIRLLLNKSTGNNVVTLKAKHPH
jgi:hypothetical protein